MQDIESVPEYTLIVHFSTMKCTLADFNSTSLVYQKYNCSFFYNVLLYYILLYVLFLLCT